MNGVNLNHFQFEFDLTWMSFFQDAAGRTYARYGGRDDHDSESHLNKASLMRVMRQVLALHDDQQVQPTNRYEPMPRTTSTPEDIPPMRRMMARRKVKCIHCHDVKVAQLKHQRDLGMLRKEMVFTYPSPARLGIQLDPEAQNVVRQVATASPAERAGIKKGDVIQKADTQRVLTFADFTRVLEVAPKTGSLSLAVQRGSQVVPVNLSLTGDWWKQGDPSWRSSTGVVGPGSGFWGVRANDAQRRQLGLDQDDLAVRITYIWGSWTREAGLKNGDVVVSIGDRTTDMTIRQLQSFLQMEREWGDSVPLVVMRRGKKVEARLNLPDKPRE